jgi:hypothetical protein
MKNVKDEELIQDLIVNIMLNFNLQKSNKSMNNNFKSEGFGIQRSEDDMSTILTKSTLVFTQFSSIFTQLTNVLPLSTYELT